MASHRFAERKDELVERQQITERERHDNDIARVQHDAARAIERAAVLENEAETARKETVQTQLELQKIRLPRRLDIDKLKAGIADIPQQEFELLYDPSAPDAQGLAIQIFVVLLQAGWPKSQMMPAPLTPREGPPDLPGLYRLLPLTQQSGGQSWGLGVVTKDPINLDPETPEERLAKALLQSVDGPSSQVSHGKDDAMPAGKIRIIVGPKLP